jgi:hypothetical protein
LRHSAGEKAHQGGNYYYLFPHKLVSTAPQTCLGEYTVRQFLREPIIRWVLV